MGTTKNGLLRGLSGKVGPVIVSNGNDLSIIRIIPKVSKKPPKKLQLVQRARFKVGTKFVRQIKDVLEIGYQSYTEAVKPLNAAVSYHVKNAVTGIYPNFKIDPSGIKISIDNGGLREEFSTTVVAVSGATLNITWNPGAEYFGPELVDRNLDETVVLIYDETKGITLTAIRTARRGHGRLVLLLPKAFTGGRLHVYFFFVSEEGGVSNSQYLGSVEAIA